MALFVDTSAFYAAADRDDTHHGDASPVFQDRGTAGDLVTTDHVVVETWLLMRARLGRQGAMAFWDAMASGVVRVLGVDGEGFRLARGIARAWPDQGFSLVDCTSFATMQQRGIREAFSFDGHFRIYRYGRRREHAFRVVP